MAAPVKKGHVTLSWDMKEFSDALKLYEQATQKEMSEIINDKAGGICIGAAKLVKNAERPPADSKLFHAIATGGTKLGVNKKHGAAVKGKGNAKVAKKIAASRNKGFGYSKAMWLKIAQDLGRKVRTKIRKLNHAHGTLAKPGVRPFATIEIDGIDQEHATRIMQPVLDKSIAAEARNMSKWAGERIAKIAAQRSGRKGR